MRGIAGTIDAVAERAVTRVSLLTDAQTHRGPDHSVIARVGGITLGNTRLAMQDPTPAGTSRSSLPMGGKPASSMAESITTGSSRTVFDCRSARPATGDHPAVVGQARCGIACRTARNVRHRSGRHAGRVPLTLTGPRSIWDQASLLGPAAGSQPRFRVRGAAAGAACSRHANRRRRGCPVPALQSDGRRSESFLEITAVRPNSVAVVRPDRTAVSRCGPSGPTARPQSSNGHPTSARR
jgi:hypothetical protein